MKTLRQVRPWIAVFLTAMVPAGLQASVGTALAEQTARAPGEVTVLGAGSPETSASDARALVVRLEDALLDLMKRADQLGFEGRLQEITPVVKETFDLELMAETSIGTVWRDLTPEVKARWVESFTRYTTTKFADQFDHFSGQQFVLAGERPASRGTVIVMTSVVRSDKEPVRLDFRVRPTDSGWRIIDVYGKGRVSELALRRSEYDAILKQGGIEDLIESVDELSARMAQKSVAPRSSRTRPAARSR